jgi:hypothetical protein
MKNVPLWNSCFGSLHLYGRNCHAWPVVITQTTRSLSKRKRSSHHPPLTAQAETRREKKDAPWVRTKLVQRLDPIDDKVLQLPLALARATARAADALTRAGAVHDDDVLGPRVALGRRALLRHRRVLKHRLLEQLAHVPERDERRGRRGDDNDRRFAACCRVRWYFLPGRCEGGDVRELLLVDLDSRSRRQLIHEGWILCVERLTRFRSYNLRIARLLGLAQQVHPLANELTHTSEVLLPRCCE